MYGLLVARTVFADILQAKGEYLAPSNRWLWVGRTHQLWMAIYLREGEKLYKIGKMNTKNDKGESNTIIHSSQKDTHHRGVALIMNRESANTLMEWEPINERLIKARFNSKYCKLTIIQCYAPANDSEDDMKEEWYDQLQAAVSKVPQHDVLLIMGDMNAKTGSDNTDKGRAMGEKVVESSMTTVKSL